MSDLPSKNSVEVIVLPPEQLDYLMNELTNIREDLTDDKYILEARKVLRADGLRSTIGCYWNAVTDDLRKKVLHRSIDLFNKEMKKTVSEYEDFQKNVTEYELIEGAYKIGVLSYEAKKVVHQARETRNMYDGHPDSSNPSLFKVLSFISDCNKYVLSVDYPIPIINVNDYINQMDTDNYSKHDLTVEQAFIDLPQLYKNELSNKLFAYYIGDTISTRFRANIEFSFPILWSVLPKESRQQLGLSFDKKYLEGDSDKNEKGTKLFSIVDGLRYLSSTTRKLIYEPKITFLEDSLDNWDEEAKAVKALEMFGSVVPDEFIERLVSALTLTFVGYDGYSLHYSRTAFYSNSAAPRITRMFEKFDNNSIEAFMNTVLTNETLKARVKGTAQLRRLRTLGDVLLNIPGIRDDLADFLNLMVDKERTKEFYSEIETGKKKKKK